jgi:dihydroorotase-like cyclic amidohydrolase
LTLTFMVATVALCVAGTATADTIYLKNGRVIQSSVVRVEGDRVIFVQYAGEVTIPLSQVERIVEDASVEPSATTPTPPPADEAEEAAAAEAEEAPEEQEQTRDYWQERVRAIAAERAQVELQIADLQRTERAFLFSHRSTADTRQAIEDAQARLVELDEEMSALETEARRLQIPAGWLRIDPAGGGGR